MTSSDDGAIFDQQAEEMLEFGITRVPADYFHFQGFRYTNLKDAIAEAKRHRDRHSGSSPA